MTSEHSEPARDAAGREKLKLDESVSHLLGECRMVLPGIQALFGFQLIAVFNQGFSEKLSAWQQQVHVVAVVLVVAAIALVMAPAALHRQAEQGKAGERFVRVASRLLLAGMIPLALAVGLEVFLVASVVWHRVLGAGLLAGALLAGFAVTWFVYPALYRSMAQAPP